MRIGIIVAMSAEFRLMEALLGEKQECRCMDCVFMRGRLE